MILSVWYQNKNPKSPRAKTWMIMKLTIILMLFFTFQAGAGSYAQRITIVKKNAHLADVFKSIETQTGFLFFYDKAFIQKVDPIDVSIRNATLDQTLHVCLKGQPLTYSIVRNTVVIQPLKVSDIERHNISSVDIPIVIANIVQGRVTNSKREPLVGVSVTVKGTITGTSTNESGDYSIDVPANGTLVFSYVGFTTREVLVNGRSSIDLRMEESVSALDQVVVVGYGTVRRGDLTGASTTISTQEIKNQPVSRIDGALQGRSTGLSIQNNSAAPDGAFTIRIRGSNSLTGSNDPLVVVDGFIGGDLSSLNPNDVAGIEILKDAASTAIYGSRGANGVILVTTKKGTNNRTSVSYNNFLNFQSISKKMDLLNAAEYAETVNANRTALGRAKPFTEEQIADFKINGGTDWQDQIFHSALQQSHNLSAAGGIDKITYYVSGNYTNNEGIIRGSSFRQYSIRSNVESRISQKFKMGVNLFFDRTESHPVITGGNQDQSPTQGALIWSPTLPVYLADGSYSRPASTFGPPAVNNPLAMAVEPINDNIGFRSELNTFISYDIVKGLTAKVLFGTRLFDRENSQYLNTKPAGGLGDASATITNNRFLVLQNTNQLDYKKEFAGVHDINVTAVFEQQRELFNQSVAGARGFSSDATSYNNLGLGTNPQVPTSTQTRKDIQSFVGRANYSFKSKYLISLTSRYDGASVFGNDKWGFFPSVALAWRMSKEHFMDQISSISDLKIRTSYGITGSQAVAPYASLSQLNTSQAYAIGASIATGVGLGTFGNPDLKWEKTAQFDLGMDISLFKGRIVFNADYYNKETSDLLMAVPLPRTSGFTSVLRNIGKVQNRGFELNLSGNPLTKEVKWNSSINFSVNNNKVIALSGPTEIPIGNTGFPNFGNTIYLVIGEPIGILKGYIQDGIWGTKDAAEAASFGTIPGAPKYIDQNGDGKINSNDIVIMGKTLPKFTYGWTNTLNYRNFELNILLQGSQGNKVYNQTRIRSERSSSDADATDRRILNRWTPDNQNTSVPSFLGSNGYEQLQSNRWLEDGSYIRVKNITLGYNVTQALLKNLKMDMLRIFVGGVNLFTFTKYTGYDPEASTNVGTLGGIDQAPYPSQKTYTVGINVRL